MDDPIQSGHELTNASHEIGGDANSATAEHRYHSYSSNRIPWYVRLIWIGFWIFAIYYVITFLLPDLQTEVLKPP